MVSLCMIVKDEAHVLERCIKSVREKMANIVSEYIIVDTGSTDGTRQLAEKLKCKVYDFEWCDDFSKARNFSINKATNDWILVIDADEFVVGDVEEEKIKKIFENNLSDAIYTMSIQRINEAGEPVSQKGEVARLFNRTKFMYEHSIHENLYSLEKKDFKIIDTNITLYHSGYLPEIVKKKNKVENYTKLMLKHLEKEPNDFRMLSQLGEMYVIGEQYEEAMKHLEKVVYSEKASHQLYYPNTVSLYMKCLIHFKEYLGMTVFEKVWEICKSDDNYVYFIAIAYFETKQYEKAVDKFLFMVNKEEGAITNKKYSYYALGKIFQLFDDNEQALICFENCIDIEGVPVRIVEIKNKMQK